jgi:serine/threonine-protein kinase
MHDLLIAGYTHGDIKPSNIFLCDDGTVKLIDLGFARADRIHPVDLGGASARTVTGTPEYMAPETLISGNAGGAARDVYSLGVTLYQMLTGSLPYQADSVAEVLRQHQQSLAPRLRSLAPDVPREVDEFVHRLLSKQPLRRGGGLSWLVRELIGLELSLLS